MRTLRLLSAFIAVFLGVTFASCGDEEPENLPVDNNLTVNYKVKITPTEDEVKYCDLKLTYIDGEGKTKWVPITGHFEKLLTYTKFPCKGGFVLSREKKADAAPDAKVNLGVEYTITRLVFNSRDELLQSKSWVENTHLTLGADKFDAYVEKNKNVVVRNFGMVVENGNIVFTE